MPTRTRIAAVLLGSAYMLIIASGPLSAQTTPKASGCTEAAEKPATKQEKGPDSGSKNMGTTGWSGGMREPGGKDANTSDKDQPATAKGLDPTKPGPGNSTC